MTTSSAGIRIPALSAPARGILSLLALIGVLALLWIPGSAARIGGAVQPLAQSGFWYSELVKVVVLYGVAMLSGLLVQRYDVRVNYTRKINHFALFFVPIFLSQTFAYQGTGINTAVSGLIFLLVLASYTEPIRRRSGLFALMFLSFDRPEDRPHTLLWLSTQTIAGYMVLLPLLVVFRAVGVPELIYIPILINAVGDGLAEPVGVRFGRHGYSVRALFTTRRYTRTLEGSACVLLTGIAVVLLFAGSFTPLQFWAALLLVPAAMTLAEALSPHTWDTPFLFLTGGLGVLAIVGLL
jgi:dolichol kinase